MLASTLMASSSVSVVLGSLWLGAGSRSRHAAG
jgi:hypothetical protein